MKTRTHDPFVAVRETGGCTFEPAIGWWTQCETADQATALGTSFTGVRDAIYIPTLQKDGKPVARELIEQLKSDAEGLGLTDVTRASGMWVLSHNGEVQSETIWIFSTTDGVDRQKLAQLAIKIECEAVQDCVAREEDGELKFTAGETAQLAEATA